MKKTTLFKRTFALILTLAMLATLFSCSMYGKSDNASGGYYPGINGGAMDGDLSGEEYTEIVENSFINTEENGTSYFSIDANTASYPNLRSMIKNHYSSIPKDAVRIEEMLNYFDYDYKTPDDGEILSLTSSMFDTPYNSETKLLTVGLAAEEVELSKVRNNLVFLIDVSGSMYSEDKLPLVQSAFMLLTESLNPEDRVSIVTYAGADSVALTGAFGNEKGKIMAVIEDLEAGGSTAGADGIETAYELAKQYYIDGGNNRVILATDGDFNVGLSVTQDLEKFIAKKRDTGIYFSVYGFGRGNIKSEKMEALALAGNGVFSYIDSVKEARRALVADIGGSLVTVAKDVKAGITFNSEYIESYRLIGYENKLLTEEEFEDSSTDAGELGSGHTVTVVYEVKLKKNVTLSDEEKLADVIIKYKPTENAGSDAQTEVSSTLSIGADSYHEAATQNDLFVASVIEFGLLLRDSEHKADANIDNLLSRLEQLDLANDEFRSEFRDIVKLYAESKNKS